METNKMLKMLEKGLLRLEDIKNNKEVALRYIELYYEKWELKFISECNLEKKFGEKLLEDEEFINEAFKYIPALLSRASEEVKNSDEVKELIKQNFIYFQYAGNKIKNDKEFILSLIKKDIEYKKKKEDFLFFGSLFDVISDELKNDGEFILEVLKLAGDFAKYQIGWVSNDNGYNSITIKDVGENVLKYRDLILYPYSFLKLCDRACYSTQCREAHQKLVEIYKDDKEAQFALIKKDDRFGEDFAKNYDKKTILEMLEITNGKGYRTIPDEMKKDREITSKAISLNGYNFKWAPAIYKDDREFVLKAVMCDGELLEDVSMELRDDEEIAMIGYHTDKSYSKTLKMSDRLKRNKKFREKLETSITWALDYKTPEERDNKEIVLEALKINGTALKLVSERLKKDEEIIKTALKQNIKAIQFVNESFITKEFVLEVLNNYDKKIRDFEGVVFRYLEKFKDDKDVMKILYDKMDYSYSFKEFLKEVNSKLLSDKEFLFSLDVYDIVDYADKKLLEDKEFLLEVGEKQGKLSLDKISDNLKKDKNFIMELFNKKIEFDYSDLDESLQKDKEIVLKYIELGDKYYFDKIIENFPKDKKIILKVIEKKEGILKELDDSFKKDKEFMLEAIKHNPLVFQFSKTKAKPIALEAFKQHFVNYKYFTPALKKDVKSFIKILKERIEEKKFIDLEEIEDFNFQLSPEIIDNDEAVITYFKVCKKEVIEEDKYFFNKVPEKWRELEWRVKLIES